MSKPSLPLAVRKLTAAFDAMSIPIAEATPTHFLAYDIERRIALECAWIDGKFLHGKAVDPEGYPTELRARYRTDVDYAKAIGLTPAQAEMADRSRDIAYNDGVMWPNPRPFFKTIGQVNAWVDSWLDRLAPDAKRLSIKKRAKKKEEDSAES